MIDIEKEIFNEIFEALDDYNSNIDCSNDFVNEPSTFPHVSVEEIDNAPYNMDNGDTERMAQLTYEVNIYTNNSGKKKSTAKAIFDVVDAVMYKRNFTRMAMTPIPNRDKPTIYRIVARYRAISDGTNIYRG